MPKPITHRCAHCDAGFCGLKYLINHTNLKHPKVDTSAMVDEHIRQAYKNRQATVKANKPTKPNADGLTYHEFVKVKTAELKATNPEITKQSDRIKVIAEMWKASKVVVEDVSVQEVAEVQEVVIISPEPVELPIPINLIKRITTAKIVDDTIDELITETDDYIKAVAEMPIDQTIKETIGETIDQTIEDTIEETTEETIEQPTEETIEETIEETTEHTEELSTEDFLLHCCRTMVDGGFVKAYHHLVKQGMVKRVKPKNKDTVKPKSINDINKDDFEDVFIELCNAWDEYADGSDDFDAGADWLDICPLVVNADNLGDFF